jgi:RNA polymerase sigma-70 factor (ECF subfamily)
VLSGSRASRVDKGAPDDDRPLIDRVRRGDQDAARTLYERYFDRIYNYVYARLGGVDAAEDLAIDTMTRSLTRLDLFRDQGVAFSSWVYRMAHDGTVDQNRRQGNVTVAPVDPTRPLEATDASEMALEQLSSEDVRVALRALTDEQQQVLILRFFQDLTAGQVADIMGKTVGAVQALQHDALGSLERGLRARPVD